MRIIFDKTGTLTMGQPEVVDLMTAPGVSEEQLLSAAAAVEAGSDHPLALAILRRASDVTAPKATGFVNLEGMGAQAEVGGKTVFLGNGRLMSAQKIDLGGLASKSAELQGAGRTVVHVAQAGLSRATLRKMHQHLWWAVGYNVIAFPLAAGVLYPVLLGPSTAITSPSAVPAGAPA